MLLNFKDATSFAKGINLVICIIFVLICHECHASNAHYMVLKNKKPGYQVFNCALCSGGFSLLEPRMPLIEKCVKPFSCISVLPAYFCSLTLIPSFMYVLCIGEQFHIRVKWTNESNVNWEDGFALFNGVPFPFDFVFKYLFCFAKPVWPCNILVETTQFAIKNNAETWNNVRNIMAWNNVKNNVKSITFLNPK